MSAVKVRSNGTGNGKKGRKELYVGGHKMYMKCVLGLKSKRKEVTYGPKFSNTGNVNT